MGSRLRGKPLEGRDVKHQIENAGQDPSDVWRSREQWFRRYNAKAPERILSFMFGADTPKGTFRPYQLSEPQQSGAVTRGAVARRRSRASGLTRLSAEAIRGFDSGFGLVFVVGPLARSAAVLCKSFVFNVLPIRKVLILSFREGR